jgi:parallel beta-helix repeat protein
MQFVHAPVIFMMNRTIFSALAAIFLLFVQVACNSDDIGINSDGGLTWIECSGNLPDTAIYYVSNSGDDDNDGLAEVTTFNTIAKALSTVRPGGTVRILPGVYRESIGVQSCGDNGKTITIEGYMGIPVMDGELKNTMGLFFENCNDYVIRNIKIMNYTDIGIGFSNGSKLNMTNLEVAENGHVVQLRDWEIEGYGIHVELSEDVQISYCNVSRNGPDPQIFPDYMMGTGINTFGNSHVRINNNISHDNIGGGMLVEDSYDVIVEDNEVYGNDLDVSSDGWWDGGIWLDGGANVLIRNNFFHDNKGPGIEISDEDLQYPTGYELKNNISTHNYYGILIWNFGSLDWPKESVLKKSGNDFTGNSKQDIWILE